MKNMPVNLFQILMDQQSKAEHDVRELTAEKEIRQKEWETVRLG